MKMKDERPESDELVNYKEEYKFNFKSGVRNVEVAFEGEFLTTILDEFLSFLQASGFSYVGKLTAVSRDKEKEWETGG